MGIIPLCRTLNVFSTPYQWEISYTALDNVANYEKYMPKDFITDDGFHITDKCREYILPLMQGEDYPVYNNGLPQYVRLNNTTVVKKLPEFKK